MESLFVTLSSKGQLVLPAEIRATLGIAPGTRIAITVDKKRIILEPISDQLVDETKGMLAGGPSLSEELQAERRADKW